jgi:hypothetical protein
METEWTIPSLTTTNNQQHDPIVHSPQTNLKTSDEEQSDQNTFAFFHSNLAPPRDVSLFS